MTLRFGTEAIFYFSLKLGAKMIGREKIILLGLVLILTWKDYQG